MSETFADILGVTLFCLAGGTLLVAIFGPRLIVRIKHLRRCPKCLYDMSGTESMTCSECGCVAKRERKLHRGRTSKARVLLALFVLLPGAHVIKRIPAIEDRGWTAGVPTTMLIVALPWLEPDLDWAEAAYAPPPIGLDVYLTLGQPSVMTPAPGWRELAIAELLDHRIASDAAWSWQIDLLEYVCDAQSEEATPAQWTWESPRDHVLGTMRWADGRTLDWTTAEPLPDEAQLMWRIREVWPVGAPIYGSVCFPMEIMQDAQLAYPVRVTIQSATPGVERIVAEWRLPLPLILNYTPAMFDGHWAHHRAYFGRVAAPLQKLSVCIEWEMADSALVFGVLRWRTVRTEWVEAPIRVAGDMDSVLSPVGDEQFEQKLADVEFSITSYDGKYTLSVVGDYQDSGGCMIFVSDPLDEALNAGRSDATFGFRFEVLCGDAVVAVGRDWFPRKDYQWPLSAVVLEDIDEAALLSNKPLRVRIVGDPEVALRNPKNALYWSGAVVRPVSFTNE